VFLTQLQFYFFKLRKTDFFHHLNYASFHRFSWFRKIKSQLSLQKVREFLKLAIYINTYMASSLVTFGADLIFQNYIQTVKNVHFCMF
jgi:hypothetical protein